MKYTGNYNLKKPDGSDVVNINDLNENADKIDTAIGTKVDKLAGKGLSTNDYSNAEKKKVANNKSTIDTHTANDVVVKHKAEQISLADNKFTSTNVEAGMGELFTNVSNGKDLVSGAITGVDETVVVPTEPSFGDLAGAIGGISTGKKWASGTLSLEPYKETTISNLDFKPNIVIIKWTNRIGARFGDVYGRMNDGNGTDSAIVVSDLLPSGFIVQSQQGGRALEIEWIATE